ncbi:hypothetical protein GCM10010112_89840 [Actinoplanes lobatus]|uniref:SHOCT domain-containing protein n=1 Tax=Actinoplanes lobatus TaxID=113568 RepID=A0ABQ4AT81_9ACTN|nr:hypothetical protein GCM10010112_89840 [Actinoplanes lobatus]GIE44226.1 hypothetical protein Alo02nite_71240 [Actinoplanes lobatus]
MEVAAVLIILVIVVTVALVLASAFWPEPEQEQEPAGTETGPAAVPEPPAGPTTLEGALVAQLISGEISARQYRRAVAKLAARDDQRQPVRPPSGLV